MNGCTNNLADRIIESAVQLVEMSRLDAHDKGELKYKLRTIAGEAIRDNKILRNDLEAMVLAARAYRFAIRNPTPSGDRRDMAAAALDAALNRDTVVVFLKTLNEEDGP